MAPAELVDKGQKSSRNWKRSSRLCAECLFSQWRRAQRHLPPEVEGAMPAVFEIYSRWGERLAHLDPGNPEWDGRDMEGRPLAPASTSGGWSGPRLPGRPRSEQGAVTILR